MPGIGYLHNLIPDGLFNGARHYAVLLVVGHLQRPAPLCLIHSRNYGASHSIRIEHHPGIGIS